MCLCDYRVCLCGLGYKRYVAHGHRSCLHQSKYIIHSPMCIKWYIANYHRIDFDGFESLAFACQCIRMSFVLFYAKYAIFIISNRAINNKRSSLSFSHSFNLIHFWFSFSPCLPLSHSLSLYLSHLICANAFFFSFHLVVASLRGLLSKWCMHVQTQYSCIAYFCGVATATATVTVTTIIANFICTT